MTDPSAADRVAALRSSRPPDAPTALAAKILTAGLSTSLVLALVAQLGHSTLQQQAADAAAARQAALDAQRATATSVVVIALPDPSRGGTSGTPSTGPVVVPAPAVPSTVAAAPADRTPPPSATSKASG